MLKYLLYELIESNLHWITHTHQHKVNATEPDRAQKLISRGFLDRNTTIALAQKCGFNSHQTFFRAFRKKTNVTPKTYLENLNNKMKIKLNP